MIMAEHIVNGIKQGLTLYGWFSKFESFKDTKNQETQHYQRIWEWEKFRIIMEFCNSRNSETWKFKNSKREK